MTIAYTITSFEIYNTKVSGTDDRVGKLITAYVCILNGIVPIASSSTQQQVPRLNKQLYLGDGDIVDLSLLPFFTNDNCSLAEN